MPERLSRCLINLCRNVISFVNVSKNENYAFSSRYRIVNVWLGYLKRGCHWVAWLFQALVGFKGIIISLNNKLLRKKLKDEKDKWKVICLRPEFDSNIKYRRFKLLVLGFQFTSCERVAETCKMKRTEHFVNRRAWQRISFFIADMLEDDEITAIYKSS